MLAVTVQPADAPDAVWDEPLATEGVPATQPLAGVARGGIAVDPRVVPHAWAIRGDRVVTVSGAATAAELVETLLSVPARRLGIPGRADQDRPPMHRLAVLPVVLALVLALAGCGGDGDNATAAASTPGTVVVRNLRYNPSTIAVDAGDTVTWVFDDGSIPHDVKGDGFESPAKSDGEWSRRFRTPGRYDYVCSLHPYMKGTVEVR